MNQNVVMPNENTEDLHVGIHHPSTKQWMTDVQHTTQASPIKP